ncbi:MAG: hypothetical protein KJZ91_24650 [Myxococcales bacterium]|nr:hypothetical protein [Myxococcales bacterium]
MTPRASALVLAAGLVASGQACAPTAGADHADVAPLPVRLADTGLHAAGAVDVLAAGVRPFSPQYPLWTDGATKRRWIYLPPGAAIDATDPDAWVFPVGTRLWKEFAFDRPVETRMIERVADGSWRFAAYLWDGDGADAVLVPGGAAVDVGGGPPHEVPAVGDCRLCHDGPTPVLGFAALQLSPDRDPAAPNAEPVPAGAVDLPALAASGQLVGLPPAYLVTPPRIAARSPTERAALGYLHGNCGGCHDDRGALAELGLDLRHALDEPGGATDPAVRTTLGRIGRAPLPGDPDAARVRIAPGAPDASVLLARVRSRDPQHQMPPLGTRRTDAAAVALLARWITELD